MSHRTDSNTLVSMNVDVVTVEGGTAFIEHWILGVLLFV